MARLASQAKMGYYPTPPLSLGLILDWLGRLDPDAPAHLLDPCCGEGEALREVSDALDGWQNVTWGIELDVDRAAKAQATLQTVIQGSMLKATVTPESFGLLWLNPPYDREATRSRTEVVFLKQAVTWLRPGGILVYLVPAPILEDPHATTWIAQRFTRIRVLRLHPAEYPRFQQVVLFGVKRPHVVEPEEAESFPSGERSDVTGAPREYDRYLIPPSQGPVSFEAGEIIPAELIEADRPRLQAELAKLTAVHRLEQGALRPLFPLRQGHLVALLTAGVLDGRMSTPAGDLIIKGYSTRRETKRVNEEEGTLITTDAYAVGVRVLDLAQGRWYDIQ